MINLKNPACFKAKAAKKPQVSYLEMSTGFCEGILMAGILD